jgi:hypothetical protein
LNVVEKCSPMRKIKSHSYFVYSDFENIIT